MTKEAELMIVTSTSNAYGLFDIDKQRYQNDIVFIPRGVDIPQLFQELFKMPVTNPIKPSETVINPVVPIKTGLKNVLLTCRGDEEVDITGVVYAKNRFGFYLFQEDAYLYVSKDNCDVEIGKSYRVL